MYLNFYGFTKSPFNTTPDTRFFFPSAIHDEALASLLYVVNEKKGFAMLTGEIGAGKTTLCRTLLSKLDPNTKTAIITNTHLSSKALLDDICKEYGIPAAGNKSKLLDGLNVFLIDQLAQNNNVVLVIDEAQNLTPSVLEEVRMISNLETEREKLIQIILMGQPELRKKIASPKLAQLNQRLTVKYHLHGLMYEDVKKYIDHRLEIAGPKRTVKFYDDAIEEIHAYSKGIPRVINIVCERALLNGFARGTHQIYKDVIDEVVRDLENFQKDYRPETREERITKSERIKLALRKIFVKPFQRFSEKL